MRKLISLGIMAAFLVAVTVPSIGCGSSGTKKSTVSKTEVKKDEGSTPNPKDKNK